MLKNRVFRLAIVAATAAFAMSMSPALAQPAGNNGFIKVDDQPLDSIPNNVPHVGCSFKIDFYNYEQGPYNATIAFVGIPPTGGGPLANGGAFIGGDPAGGGNDFDGTASFNLSAALSGITPHPQQGHHVRVDIHAPFSQGNDSKSKVFWVEGCGTPPTTTTTSTTTSTTTTTAPTTTTTAPTTTTTCDCPTTTTTVPETTTTTRPPRTTTTAGPTTTTTAPSRTTTTEGPAATTTTTAAPQVVAPTTVPPKTPGPPAVTPPLTLPLTGNESLPYAAVGLGLLAGGALLSLVAHKRLRNAS